MGQLYLFCREPSFYFPPLGSKADDLRINDNIQIPIGRDACVEAIASSLGVSALNNLIQSPNYIMGQSSNPDAYTANVMNVPWHPWNFTNPCATSKTRPAVNMSYDNLIYPITTVVIQYSEINSVGMLVTTLHADSYYPSVGDYITAVWTTTNEVTTNANEITGIQLFYGRVVESKRTSNGITILAHDALAPLLDSDQVTMTDLTPDDAIYHVCLRAGVYLYQTIENNVLTSDRRPTKIHTNIYTGTYLDTIVELLQRWYLETGRRHYIQANGGLAELCTYDNNNNLDVIDASMMRTWSCEQITEHTYTRVVMTYPKKVAKLGKTGKTHEVTENRIYNDHARNMMFRLPRFHTFRYRTNSGEDAKEMADYILRNHSMPTFKIVMTDVIGLPHLRPGMKIAVPFKRDDTGVTYIGLCLVRTITHNFDFSRHTMNIVAEWDPYQSEVDPVDATATVSLMAPTEWRSGITITTLDTYKPTLVKRRKEVLIQNFTTDINAMAKDKEKKE